MKQTTKVSIGTIAFNLDEDAYKALDNYLNSLKQHFANSEDAKEIISDIEMRLGELLQMRRNNDEEVVSLEDATTIINIMGTPKDFVKMESDESEESVTNKQTNYKEPKKKLFRDIDEKILGGVCSGLSHFFRIDTVIFRGAFILLFFIIAKQSEFGVIIPIIYLVLWLIMPKAVTFEQKIRMTGVHTSIANVTDRNLLHNKEYKGSVIRDILKFIGKATLIILGIFFFICFICFFAFFVWAIFDTNILLVQNYIDLMGFNSFGFKVALFLILVLPILGILNLIVKLYKWSPLKSQNFILLALGIGLWLVAGAYLGSIGGAVAYKHQRSATAKETKTIATSSNVLYIDLGEEYTEAKLQPSNPYMLYKDNEEIRQYAILPSSVLIINAEDSTFTNQDYIVEFISEAHGESWNKAEYEVSKLKVDYAITDSLLTINPQWYDKNNPWDMTTTRLKITVLPGKEVKTLGYLRSVYHKN